MISPARIAFRLAALLVFVLALPLLAASDGSDPAFEKNARLLLLWKQDPEHYARLKRDYLAFQELPPERQAQLRKLDRDLAALPAEQEATLLRVLDRYAAFVESLSEADRESLKASTGEERIRLIGQLRQKQWYEQLPYQLREDLSKLPDEKRAREVARIAEEDRRRKWLLTSDVRKKPFPASKDGKEKAEPFQVKPTQMSQYPHEVLSFFEFHIRERLTPEERKRLTDAEGKVAPLAREMLALSEKYPVLPASESKLPITGWKDLPQDWKKTFPLQKLEKDKKGVFKKEVSPHEGKWPDFALALTRVAPTIDDKAKDLSPLGPSKLGEYPPEVQPALKRLYDQDPKTLSGVEGKWPDHPMKVHELARKSNVYLPGMSLPGAKASWDGLLREEK